MLSYFNKHFAIERDFSALPLGALWLCRKIHPAKCATAAAASQWAAAAAAQQSKRRWHPVNADK